MQVGRRPDPLQDAAVVLAVRQAVGPGIVLRADANRAWSLEQAVKVGHFGEARMEWLVRERRRLDPGLGTKEKS